MKTSRLVVSLALPGLILGSAACGGKSTPSSAGKTTNLAVTLQEYAVIPAQASSPAGRFNFTVENKGPMHDHEFVVIRTDLAPDALPTKPDGSVEEGGAGIIQVIGEIEEFSPGKTETTTMALAAGKYVFVCNVVDTHMSETTLVHYKLGMRTAFTVT